MQLPLFTPLLLFFINCGALLYVLVHARGPARKAAAVLLGGTLMSASTLQFMPALLIAPPVQIAAVQYAGQLFGAVFPAPLFVLILVSLLRVRRTAAAVLCGVSLLLAVLIAAFSWQRGVPSAESRMLFLGPALWLQAVNLLVVVPLSIAGALKADIIEQPPVVLIRQKKFFCGAAVVSLLSSAAASVLLPASSVMAAAGLICNSAAFLFLAFGLVHYKFLDVWYVVNKLVLALFCSVPLFFLYGLVCVVLLPVFPLSVSTAVATLAIIFVMLFTPLVAAMRRIVDSLVYSGRTSHQAVLTELSQSLISILDLDQLLERILHALEETLNSRTVAVFLSEEDSMVLELRTGIGMPELQSTQIVLSSEAIERLRHRGVSFLYDLMQESILDEAAVRHLRNLAAEVVVPISFKRQLMGIIALGPKRNEEIYSVQDIEVLQQFGGETGLAIEHSRVYNEAIIDRLTRVYNRHYFYVRLREELARGKRYRRPLIVLLVEIADFTAFAQARGKAAADLLVRNVSLLIKTRLRNVDILARFAEETFAVILPEIGRETTPAGERNEQMRKDAQLVTSRLREHVRTLGGSPESDTGLDVYIGWTCIDEPAAGITAEDCVRQVETALTAARKKEDGTIARYGEDASGQQ